MFSYIKNIVFWTFDYIQGGKIRKAYNNIEKYYRMDSTSSKLEEHYKKSLNILFKQATYNTIYYQTLKGEKDLLSYPVVNKKIIANKQELFLSKKYLKKKLIKMSTSGSTGTPFVSYQNVVKKKHVNAETIFFNGKAGYKVGSKLVFLRSLNNNNQKSKIKQWIQNQRLIDINKLDNDNIRQLFNQIKGFTRNKGATMLSYASTYDILRDYFKKNDTEIVNECNIHGIISTSEILFDETRKYMSDAFSCNCYSRYANMENGMLGQDTPNHPNTFILNEAHYYIEILRLDSDEPAKFGEVGRVVVTDLYNYAMPMIRYDTGDVGAITFVKIDGKKKKALTNFGGRKIDMVFDTNGNAVSPHKISVAFWSYPELKQFQFIQEDKEKFYVLLDSRKTFTREAELIQDLKSILGKAAKIDIKIVKSIPVLPSGKRKYIINKTL